MCLYKLALTFDAKDIGIVHNTEFLLFNNLPENSRDYHATNFEFYSISPGNFPDFFNFFFIIILYEFTSNLTNF